MGSTDLIRHTFFKDIKDIKMDLYMSSGMGGGQGGHSHSNQKQYLKQYSFFIENNFKQKS